MYVVVRTDLSIPQIAVQACHSAFEAYDMAKYEEHPSIILCGVKNEEKLRKELDVLTSLGLNCRPFYENDLDNQMTSFCVPVKDEDRHFMRRLQLLRSPK